MAKKIAWHQLICVDCTDTRGEKCDINSCETSCRTRQAIEEKKTMVGPKQVRAFPIQQSSTPRFFKYSNELYQSVQNFCDNYDGLKKGAAREAVVNTIFPKSAYLVIPGHSENNYRWIPDDWKNGHQELNQVKNAAYLLEHREKPAGKYLLLVSRNELKKSAISALSPLPSKTERKKPKKKAGIANKAKTKPILPIVARTYGKKEQAPEDNDNQKNPFSTRHMGLCPTCEKATDISKLNIDPRGRSRCPQKHCKSQTKFFHWSCVQCSGKGRKGQSVRRAQPVHNYFQLAQIYDFVHIYSCRC